MFRRVARAVRCPPNAMKVTISAIAAPTRNRSTTHFDERDVDASLLSHTYWDSLSNVAETLVNRFGDEGLMNGMAEGSGPETTTAHVPIEDRIFIN